MFTNSPLPMLRAESTHRGHAIMEQVIARPEQRCAGAPAVRALLAQMRQAGLRGHRFNSPAPLGPRVRFACQVHNRRDPRATDQRPGPTRALRQATGLPLPQPWPWEHAWRQMLAATGPPPPARPVHPSDRTRPHRPGAKARPASPTRTMPITTKLRAVTSPTAIPCWIRGKSTERRRG